MTTFKMENYKPLDIDEIEKKLEAVSKTHQFKSAT